MTIQHILRPFVLGSILAAVGSAGLAAQASSPLAVFRGNLEPRVAGGYRLVGTADVEVVSPTYDLGRLVWAADLLGHEYEFELVDLGSQSGHHVVELRSARAITDDMHVTPLTLGRGWVVNIEAAAGSNVYLHAGLRKLTDFVQIKDHGSWILGPDAVFVGKVEASAAGRATVQGHMPALKELVGLDVTMQAVVVSKDGAYFSTPEVTTVVR